MSDDDEDEDGLTRAYEDRLWQTEGRHDFCMYALHMFIAIGFLVLAAGIACRYNLHFSMAFLTAATMVALAFRLQYLNKRYRLGLNTRSVFTRKNDP